TVNAWSLNESDHALQVAVNGLLAGEARWNGGGKMLALSFQIPSGALLAGANTIELITPAIPGADDQLSFLHSMKLDYTRLLNAGSPLTIVNTSTSTKLYELHRLATPNAWVIDTRYDGRETLVPFETQLQADGTYRLRFNAGP